MKDISEDLGYHSDGEDQLEQAVPMDIDGEEQNNNIEQAPKEDGKLVV